MLRLNFNLSFLLLIIPLYLQAQNVDDIIIEGNSAFPQSDYEEYIFIPDGSPFFPGIEDSIKNRITAFLSENGYFHHAVNRLEFRKTEDSTRQQIFIDIDEGTPTYIHNIFFDFPDSVYADFLKDEFDYLKGEILIPAEIAYSIDNTLSFYEENGFPFITVTIESVHFYDDTVDNDHLADLYLHIEQGDKSRVDSIEITGNSSTKDFVILRAIDLRKGELYTKSKIDDIPAKLNRLRFFEPVPEPMFYYNSKGTGILQIAVKERNTNNFDGIIGYIPGDDEEDGYVTGLVNVSMRNLFGTGRAAAVRWEQFDRNSQELELKYLEPYILGYPFNIQLGLWQKKQDTTYVQRKFDGALEYLATDEFSLSFNLTSESVIPSESDSTILTVYNSSLLTTGVTVRYDNRDDPLSPTGGILFVNTYALTQKEINGPEQFLFEGLQTDINQQRILIDLIGFYELFSRNVLMLGLHGRELGGPLQEESDLFLLGGTNSLRGYRENQFRGSRIAWANLEYRLMLSRRTYGFLFYDAGYYLRKADEQLGISESDAFKSGYGLGISLETGLGILAVSFALADGDSFSDGKIHFGIINEF